MSETIKIRNVLLFELLSEIQSRADNECWFKRNPKIVIEQIGDFFEATIELEASEGE